MPLVVVALSCAARAAPADAGALHVEWIDPSVSPAVDFYGYANGGWQAQNPVPPGYGRWSVFDVVRRHTEEVVRGILERAAADTSAAPGSLDQKIGDFYASGMDEAAIEAAGISPLADELSRIDSIASSGDLQGAIAHLHMIGVEAAFSFGQMPDFADSTYAIGAAFQGGLGLPDRTYYLDPDFAAIRAAYLDHVTKTLGLLGDRPEDAALEAAAIMDLETRLAKASLPRARLRDPHAIYHPMDRAALAELTPSFSWPDYFAAVGKPEIQRINVATPGFFEALDDELSGTDLATLRAYLRWHLVSTFAPYLSRAFQEESFRLHSALTGAKEMLPRWQRVLDAADAVLGFAVGKRYVEEAFSKEAKDRAIALLHGIRGALADDLATLDWMSPETRKAALEKLGLMAERIGYPERWRDYSGLSIDRGPWVLNVKRGKAFEARREIDKIDRPVDRSEWAMTPQTVNAYYNPSTNDINFPAAILQPPFFDPGAPDALNYGAIGFVMGHEITHGFDDEGAQFDGKGNLRNWWTPGDLDRFHAITECVADQFSSFTVDDVHLDGNLVVGEATADLGGLALAVNAFRAASAGPDLAGFTPAQQFFLASAHVWASNARPEEERLRATTDPHPPPRYRVNGTFANNPAFAEAFSVPAGSPMARTSPCKIW